ncbi:MAG: hypothetical protein WC516_02340 [Patescibacteria group bacterium]
MDFKGIIIAESLRSKDLINDLNIINTEVEAVNDSHQTAWLKQWTMHTVEIPESQIEELAQKISENIFGRASEHSWYADFKNEAWHYIIFADKVFKVDRSDREQYQEAKKYGISRGIPEYQVNFSPEIQ